MTMLGQRLVDRGLITQAELDESLALQKSWGGPLGQILLAKGFVRAQPLYRAIAEHYALPFVDLRYEPLERELLIPEARQTYLSLGLIPWRRDGDRIVIATTDMSPAAIEWAERTYGPDAYGFVITSSFDIVWQVGKHFGALDDHEAREQLWADNPLNSAKFVLTGRQKAVGLTVLLALAAGFALQPIDTAVLLSAILSVFYLFTFLLKFVLTWIGAGHRVDMRIRQSEIDALKDEDLPLYSILVPMYQEPDILPVLTNALRNLDYPRAKLDIKLVLESGDSATIEAAKSLGCESIFQIIRVPKSEPKTKPKACNYALRFARGEYVTIYDAEDKPEPDQLKKVVAAFRKAPPEIGCIQARLNYYNTNENFLARMFTLEYSQWFDFLLPGLDVLGIPIPLGGTSNHFKLDVLRRLGAWDPYNVTEDADLGIRMNAQGWRVGVVNSTTFEEANTHLGNWIRQRSRWLKGYLQTYLVHMRRPVALYRSLGHVGFWGLQFFVGGPPLVALINPLLWIVFLSWIVARDSLAPELFPPAVLYVSIFNLLFGNMMLMYFGVLAAFKRSYFHLVPYGLLLPIYWALQSIAAYKGLWQLMTAPHYWEKTVHGLSAVTRQEIRERVHAG